MARAMKWRNAVRVGMVAFTVLGVTVTPGLAVKHILPTGPLPPEMKTGCVPFYVEIGVSRCPCAENDLTSYPTIDDRAITHPGVSALRRLAG
jgi:hypothetical protein